MARYAVARQPDPHLRRRLVQAKRPLSFPRALLESSLTPPFPQRKKRFAGHTIAGYACEPQFSPDGRFLSSGDGQGNMVFWDWKTCRIVSRFKAHNQVIISHAWLPHETVSLFLALGMGPPS